MATITTGIAMPALVITAVLFSTSAWADRAPRTDVPPIPADHSMAIHGAHPHGMEAIPESKPLMREGVAVDAYIDGTLNRSGVRAGADERPMDGAYPSTNVTRPSEISKPDSGAAGVPLWRW
jgi:hypothetical protein